MALELPADHKKRDGIRRVFLINSARDNVGNFLRVAVISRNEDNAALNEHCVHDAPDLAVIKLDRFHGCLNVSRVRHHVGIGEVGNDEIVRAGFYFLHNTVRYFFGRHLGRLVVLGHFG